MAVVSIMNRVKAAKYDGSNASDFVLLFQNSINYGYTPYASADVNSGGTNGSQCTINLRDGSNAIINTYVAQLNCWTIVGPTGVNESNTPDDFFMAVYQTFSDAAQVMGQQPAFTAAVAAASAGNAGAFGSLPGITVNGLSNANFDVPIRPMMPNNSFTAVPVLTGSASLLGGLSITGLSSGLIQTSNKLSTTVNGVTMYDRCRVNVANSGALQLAGAALLVHVSP